MGSCFDYRDNAVLLIPVLPVRRSTYDLEYRCYIEDCSNRVLGHLQSKNTSCRQYTCSMDNLRSHSDYCSS